VYPGLKQVSVGDYNNNDNNNNNNNKVKTHQNSTVECVWCYINKISLSIHIDRFAVLVFLVICQKYKSTDS